MRYARVYRWDDVSLGGTIKVRLTQDAPGRRTFVGVYHGLASFAVPGGRMVYIELASCKNAAADRLRFPVDEIQWIEVLVGEGVVDG